MKTQAANSLAREDGCHQFDICVAPEAPGQILLYEVYENHAAFDAHLASDHYAAFDTTAGPLMTSKTARFFQRLAP